MKKTLAATTVGLFALSSHSAFADPISMGTGFSSAEVVALVSETLVVAILLGLKGFDFPRMIYTWIPVTYLTYWIFMFGGGALFDRLGRDMNGLVYASVLVLLESLVIAVEACIIVWLSKKAFFHKSACPMKLAPALLISFAGNMTSIGVGILCLKMA